MRRALRGQTNAPAAPQPAAPVTPPPASVPAATPAAAEAAPDTAVPPPLDIPAPAPAAINPAAGANTPPAVVPPAPGALPAPGSAPALNPPGSTNTPAEEIIQAGTINFPATELGQVLKIYAELKGRTVLRPATLPNPQITLITQTPLTKKEAIAAFDAVFQLNGIAAVDVGDKFVQIVPTAQAGQLGAPFSKESADLLPDMGPYVTHVVQLTYNKPSEIVQALTPFASVGMAQGILPIDSSQVLILRDFAPNVKRMLEMVKKIDISVPSEYDSKVIPIKYALASDIASALNSLSTGGGGTTVGSSATGGASMGAGTRSGFGTSGMGGRSTSGFGNRTGMGNYPGMNTGTTPFGTTAGAQQGTSGTFTDRLQRIIQRASASGEITVLGQTKIIADERTNSLLIFASKEDLKMIEKIVTQLDVVLAQVLIEAVIIEVSLNDNKSLGVSYLQRNPSAIGNFRGIGAINNNNILNANNFLLGGGTNLTGGVKGGFSYLGTLGDDLDVSITAVAGNGRARILQRPRIQTSHAVPASIFVGESRPYPQGSYYGGGSFGGYSTIQQLQIGVSLDVTPLINPEGLVVMDIHQKIESFKGNVTIQGVGDVPVTSSKDATAKVAVRDHDTIMLGGLIENSKNMNNSGVPFLKDLPLLGPLFRSTSTDSTRSELVVLIRPTVLPTPQAAAVAARDEKNHLPEVMRLEKEIQAESAKRRQQYEKEKSQQSP
jgi:general secretion pathway protein D